MVIYSLVWIIQMNNSHFSMRSFAKLPMILFGPMTAARTQVFTYDSCQVTAVNQSTRTFTVRWPRQASADFSIANPNGGSSRPRTFQMNEKTAFWVGNTKGSLADLVKGALVNVSAHSDGPDRVADKVQIVLQRDALL
jgi:hypothetical protein